MFRYRHPAAIRWSSAFRLCSTSTAPSGSSLVGPSSSSAAAETSVEPSSSSVGDGLVPTEVRPLGIVQPNNTRGIVYQKLFDDSVLPATAQGKGMMNLVKTNTSMEVMFEHNHDRSRLDMVPQHETELDPTLDKFPLHRACIMGDLIRVGLLLDHGHNIEEEGQAGWRPLHFAIDYKHPRVVELLLERGADPTAKTANQCTALHRASLAGEPRSLRAVLETKKCGLEDLSEKQWTPIHYATWSHSVLHSDACVKLLANAGADLEAKTDTSHSPLHFAALRNQKHTIEYLLQCGVNPDPETSTSKATPLHLACQAGAAPAAVSLIDGGADALKVANGGMTPMHYAALYAGWELVDVLSAANSPLDVMDDGGFTPLHLAAKRGNRDMIEILMRIGEVKLNRRSKADNMTAAEYAHAAGHTKLYQWLLTRGAVGDQVEVEGEESEEPGYW